MNAAKFLILTLTGFFFIALSAVTLVFATDMAGRSPFPYKALFDYQIEKLESGDIETLFVGDSSLGNAIDAQEWSRLSGTRTLNAALTGKFGYGGSLNMIRRGLQHNPELKTVIIFQTADMMKRPVAHELYARSLPAGEETFATYLAIAREKLNLEEIRSSLSWLADAIQNKIPEKQPNPIADDYMPQTDPKDFSNLPGIRAGDASKNKSYYLRDIKTLCESENLSCVYMHGPLASPRCEASKQYIQNVNKIISETGMKVIAETPVCIAPEHYGDSADHVATPFKKQYTRRYFALFNDQD